MKILSEIAEFADKKSICNHCIICKIRKITNLEREEMILQQKHEKIIFAAEVFLQQLQQFV